MSFQYSWSVVRSQFSRKPFVRHSLALAVGLALVATPVLAQDKTAEVDKIFSSITADAPGCAAGATKNGNTVVNRYYGISNVDTRAPHSSISLFDTSQPFPIALYNGSHDTLGVGLRGWESPTFQQERPWRNVI